MSLKSSTKTDVNTTELIIEINPTIFENAVEAAYQKQKKNISLPGFRKGKVSRKMAEKQYGEGVFYEDAVNSLIGPEIDAAVTENKIQLVDRPQVEVLSLDKEKGVEIKAVCITKPEIEISDYKGIKAAKIVKDITDEDVDDQLKSIRQRNARIVSVDDRAAQLNDEVILDFEGFFGDEPFEGGKGEDHPLKLGSGQFIPGFEEQIVGHNIGDEFDVNVKFPEEYQMEEYAGKDATFKCKLKSISYEELPELDDELVKDATEFDTLEEYKADIRKKLEENAVKQADLEFENSIMTSIIEKVDSPIPNCMYEKRIDALVHNFEQTLSEQGMSIDVYFQYTGMDMDSFRETNRERAVNEVKLRLALEKIAELEKFELSEDEINAGLEDVAAANKTTVEIIKRYIPMDDYKTDLLVHKAIDFVKENAVVDNTVATSTDAE
ncbi:MAG: trigger factor [Ruminococcus sp.]|jgi:trigger factor|nr:trigger factor [Ruminococcus sp.]